MNEETIEAALERVRAGMRRFREMRNRHDGGYVPAVIPTQSEFVTLKYKWPKSLYSEGPLRMPKSESKPKPKPPLDNISQNDFDECMTNIQSRHFSEDDVTVARAYIGQNTMKNIGNVIKALNLSDKASIGLSRDKIEAIYGWMSQAMSIITCIEAEKLRVAREDAARSMTQKSPTIDSGYVTVTSSSAGFIGLGVMDSADTRIYSLDEHGNVHSVMDDPHD